MGLHFGHFELLGRDSSLLVHQVKCVMRSMFKHTVAFSCCFLLTLAFFSGTVASLTCKINFRHRKPLRTNLAKD